MLHDFHEARKYFRRHDRSIYTEITVKVHLHISHNGVDHEAPLPEILSDQDCDVEIALPPDSELQTDDSYELVGRMLREGKHQQISLDDILKVFHIDPGAKYWELEPIIG